MTDNGGTAGPLRDSGVLRWPGRVVTAEELRRSLNGHREIALRQRAILTPLAAEYLKTNGIHVSREAAPSASAPPPRWGLAQQQPMPLVASAAQSLRREGMDLQEFCQPDAGASCRWAQVLAECVARGQCQGGVVFCADPGLICCVANKVPGLRAAAVMTVSQAARATLTLGANLLVVEMPGRTFFEVRQILRVLCSDRRPACPAGVACTLEELDGHAHR